MPSGFLPCLRAPERSLAGQPGLRLFLQNDLRVLAPHPIVGPEQPRGDSAPWRPLFRDPPELLLFRARAHPKALLHADLQGEVAGRKNVGMADAEEEIDLRRPW